MARTAPGSQSLPGDWSGSCGQRLRGRLSQQWVEACIQVPELTLKAGDLPDLLVTYQSPSPSLENEENDQLEAYRKRAGVCNLPLLHPWIRSHTAHSLGIQACVPSSFRVLILGWAAVAQLT